MTVEAQKEVLGFQAEVKQLLDLSLKSQCFFIGVYRHKNSSFVVVCATNYNMYGLSSLRNFVRDLLETCYISVRRLDKVRQVIPMAFALKLDIFFKIEARYILEK